MSIIKWNPFALNKTHFGDFFDDFFTKGMADFISPEFSFRNPSVNVKENNKNFVLEFAVPGLKKDDFKIEIENDHLIVSAERKGESEVVEENYSRREFNYSSFKRSFYLPESVNQKSVEARYEDGILVISLGKKEEAKLMADKKVIEIQ
ncbi:MAG: Hsp20/alpha crystallin family protein [Melioribacteraceae bacterium]|nr:Hsp20/alpha crystallin family protein [Melioribacteraceae bacterium]